jgi:hypothetical protein
MRYAGQPAYRMPEATTVRVGTAGGTGARKSARSSPRGYVTTRSTGQFWEQRLGRGSAIEPELRGPRFARARTWTASHLHGQRALLLGVGPSLRRGNARLPRSSRGSITYQNMFYASTVSLEIVHLLVDNARIEFRWRW